MDQILRAIKKIIPVKLFRLAQPAYHFCLAYLGALVYGFPSRKMFVVGVTGTKGKSTTSYLIAQLLNSAGLKTGMATTVLFKIGEKEWLNSSKQTMLGRFQLQQLLAKMAKEGCEYAVVETSSEGILQYRHTFIDYDAAVFTNLSPEHIERHGSFENYRDAKVKLFEKVAEKENSVGVYNLDDANVGYFLAPKIPNQYVFTSNLKMPGGSIGNLYQITKIKSGSSGTSFLINNEEIKTPLIGRFNVYNAAAAICFVLSQGVEMAEVKKAMTEIKPPPGRLELVKANGFNVVVDYAHEPASLEAVYKAVIESKIKSPKGEMVCLFGSQGGGRDKWKRQAMGRVAAEYCDKIILTNEDPYDESPIEIINQVSEGIVIDGKNSKVVYKIIDREEAIKKAISLAGKDDAVVLTGKGGEVWMCVENGKKIPWDERKTVEDLLGN
ncbi:MAG: UDP-N-acetylmuramoyl-L-alanyl-D-glutamate--2,6-diaminopimelate ligase [Candidatus Paceibacterota bacterium]